MPYPCFDPLLTVRVSGSLPRREAATVRTVSRQSTTRSWAQHSCARSRLASAKATLRRSRIRMAPCGGSWRRQCSQATHPRGHERGPTTLSLPRRGGDERRTRVYEHGRRGPVRGGARPGNDVSRARPIERHGEDSGRTGVHGRLVWSVTPDRAPTHGAAPTVERAWRGLEP